MKKVVSMDRQADLHQLCLQLRERQEPPACADLMQAVVSELINLPFSVISDCAMLLNLHVILDYLQFEESREVAAALLGVLGLPNSRCPATILDYHLELTRGLAFDVIAGFLFQTIPCSYEPARQPSLLLSALALFLRAGITDDLSGHIFAPEFWEPFCELMFLGVDRVARVLYLIVKGNPSKARLKPVIGRILACCRIQIAAEGELQENTLFWWRILNLLAGKPGDESSDRRVAIGKVLQFFELLGDHDRMFLAKVVIIEILRFLVKKTITCEMMIPLIPLMGSSDMDVAILVDEMVLQFDYDQMLAFVDLARESGTFDQFMTNLIDQALNHGLDCIIRCFDLLNQLMRLEDIWHDDIIEVCRRAAMIESCRPRAIELLKAANERSIQRGEGGLCERFPDDDDVAMWLEIDFE